jgi:hypothetical protein
MELRLYDHLLMPEQGTGVLHLPTRNKPVRTLALLLAALVYEANSAAAQPATASSPPTRVAVTIALVEQLPHPGAPFVILRRVNEAEHDVILLPADADAQQLSLAVQALLTARSVAGDTAESPATIRVRPHAREAGAHRQFPWIARVHGDLQRAAHRPIRGVGSARAVVIWLPPQRPRR